MTDNIVPQEENDAENIEGVQNIDKMDDDHNHRQGIFDELFHALMDGFGQACEQQQVEVAIAIAKLPNMSEPVVFYRGHIVDAAALTADVLRQVKRQIYEQLNTELPQ